MNKIACCVSGLPSKKIIDYIKFLSKYKNLCDFFIFMWDIIDDRTKREIVNVIQPKNIIFARPVRFDFDAKYKEPDKKEHKNNALSMFYGISEVQKMRKSYEEARKTNYEVVIRMRYDIYFIDEFEQLLGRIVPLLNNQNVIFPWERNHIGLCDQIWIGNSHIMDHFINIFEWIKTHINDIYFVNENLMYQFVTTEKIKPVCFDIRYTLIRDNMVQLNYRDLVNEYSKQKLLPWVKESEEKRDKFYEEFISIKNNSANTLYFLTRQVYCQLNVKIQNNKTKKYMYINEAIDSGYVLGSDKMTIFSQNMYNVWIVNYTLMLRLPSTSTSTSVSTTHSTYAKLTLVRLINIGNKLIYHADTVGSDVRTQFYLIKKNDSYLIVSNYLEANKFGTYGQYVHMNDSGIIYCDGDKNLPESLWNIIIV